ncbi:Transposon Ty3-G Gag-Pol polyprotein [Trichinella nelsoni]|uniref:Transposon Ty3-G Gag-Pol polyprotein n=1 Tax=Trichinella nelsoni TaxID=6336 RepID=A0A0V0SKQ3_9BILA|nr:Transposon Ty3-G Gag-Pol polyprotein [Trichinella nelsoni]
MLKRDVVEMASSPWASLIVLVKKKDGLCRFCVDYQQLNTLIRKDAHPLLRIDYTLDALAGAQWSSTLDQQAAIGRWRWRNRTRRRRPSSPLMACTSSK